MLAPGNYVQWKSIIKRYIDTKPNHELINYCLTNPPYKLDWKDKEVPISEGSPITRSERVQETYKNVSQEIRDQLNAEAEAVQIILTGIDIDIYSTVDACPNACEIWKAIERLKQGESINVQDLETNLYWEFGKFTSQDGESLESYYLRFYKMMNELIRNQCKVTNHQVNVQLLLQLQSEWQRFVTLVKQSQELETVSYHKLYDILKQNQHEVNEIRAERIARIANLLAFVAQQQPVYNPQNHPTHYTHNSSTRSQQAATRNRGKAIVNSPQPIYDQEPSMVAKDDETSKDKEIDKLMALISLSVKDAAYHREKMLLCKKEEARIQLNAEQADWRDDIDDDELEDQELEAHYMYMAQLQEDGESLESYYSRFYKMMNELIRNQCKVANHQVNVQFLLQLQPEWQRSSSVSPPPKETMTTVNQGMSVEEIKQVAKRQKEKVEENASNKSKWGSNHNGSLNQQNKGHKVPRAHTAWPINKKAYARSLPLCNQCKFHHNGSCTVKCGNCKKVGHIIQNCRTPATAKNQRTRTCYECGSLRYYKSECLIVKFYKHVDMIHGRVRASKPKTMQDVIKIATKLMNKKISTLVECQNDNKKRLDNSSKNNQNQQQPNKRQNIGRAYTAMHGEKKHYGRSKPLCSKCYYHHDGPCAPKCHQCNRFGHLARDYRSSTNTNTTNIQKGTGASQKATCYDCGNQVHYRRDCPERKNQNHENQIESTKACGVVHAFRGGETK
nr:hypothetical protein [Tanacetum cinerariifolium]